LDLSFNATVSFAFEFAQVEQIEGFFYVYNSNLIGEIPERSWRYDFREHQSEHG